MISRDVKKIRLMMGLSQKEIASLMGMNQQGYSRIETGYKGRKPTKQHIATIRILKFISDKKLLSEYVRSNNSKKKLM